MLIVTSILATLPSYSQSATAAATYGTISNLNLRLNLSDFAGTSMNPTHNIAQISSMHYNFALRGGGLMAVSNVGGTY